MLNTTNKVLAHLVTFSLLLLLSYNVITKGDYIALPILLLLLTLVIAVRIIKLFIHEQQRLQPVLRALVNDDVTLGLAKDSPLEKEFNQVRDEINRSHREVQNQHQFLQAMLVHLDVGVLVLSNEGRILQKNPALLKLLGNLPDNISDKKWQQLGKLINATSGNCNRVLRWCNMDNSQQQDTLSVRISCSRINGEFVKIISIQSIYHALQTKEQQAYKQLTKVLTHEIANSIMPMVSLAQTGKTLIPNSLTFDQEDKEDLKQALTAIARRAEHLDQFINRFAEVSRLPLPELTRVEIIGLLEQILSLYKNSSDIRFIKEHQKCEFWLMADAAQIEQVIVNLVKNAVEALANSAEKQIKLTLYYNNLSQLVLDIHDSGPGIEQHVQAQIFIPFFTTKQLGSGIGLSLSKQVMVNHGGDLLYIDGELQNGVLPGACFRMIFS